MSTRFGLIRVTVLSLLGLVIGVLLVLALPVRSPVLAKTTITFLGRGTAQERAIYDEVMQDFMKEHKDIEVDTVWEAGDAIALFEKLQVMAAGGAAPDVFWVHSYHVADLAALKALYPLDELIAADKQFGLDAYFAPPVREFQSEGRQVALPRETSSLVLYYNQDRFDEAGLVAPDKTWTWATLLAAARKLTGGEGAVRKWGFHAPTYHGYDLTVVWQNEGEFLTADRKKSAVLNPRTIEAYQWIYNLMYKEKVAPTAAELGNTSVFSAFQSGRIGMMYEIRATSMVLNGVKFNYDVAVLPQGRTRATRIASSGHAIYAGTKHPQEAWELLKYLSGTKAETLFARGGLSIPALQAVALSEAFLSPNVNPAHDEAFLESLLVGRPEPITRNWFSIVREKNAIMANLWNGQKPVETVLQELDQRINSWLSK